MEDINQLVAALSPEKRALFEKHLLKHVTPAVAEHEPALPFGMRLLSFGQESLWFFHQLDSSSTVYNLPQAFRLRGVLNVEALRRALEAIVHRHDVLRTNYVSNSDAPEQVVAGKKKFDLPVVDLSSATELDRAVQMQCHLDIEARRPFDFAKDVMLRAGLIRLSSEDHILAMSIHHIASDAWSLRILNDELSALYEDFCDEKPPSLPALKSQYLEFAIAQRKRFQNDAGQQIEFWKKRLAGELPVMELPFDRSRPAVQNYQGTIEYFKFPQELMLALKELSRRESATVYSLTLAVFNVLLQRYSRSDDILVGSPLANRNQTDCEKLIGYFINMLVLRSDLSGNPTFREFLRRVNQNVLDALAHPDVSLERLVEELKVVRQPGRNPLVEVVFQFMAEPPHPPKLRGLSVEPIPIQTQTSKFDMTLTLQEAPDGLRGEVEYNTDLFDAATIRRMLGHYRVLLEAVVANPSERIDRLPILTGQEREQILSDWNNTRIPHEQTLIHEQIAEQARRNPDGVAVVCGEHSLTYAELNQRSNQLARHLQKNGVAPETAVCLCVDRSVEMIVGILGILKAGGAYVPLDPDYPKDRLAIILQESGAPLLLTKQRIAGDLPQHPGKTIRLDTDWPVIERENADEVVLTANAENLAYIIFTSGSTGRPKGVLVTHGNFVHSTMARRVFYREPVENYLMISSFSFDSSVAGIFWTLAGGGTLTLPANGLHNDPAELIRLIEQKQISHFLALPSLYQLILENVAAEQLQSLRVVIIAGESAPVEIARKHADIFGSNGATLFNEYGPTEASVWSTVEVCDAKNEGALLIGKAIPNTQVYILDSNQNPVPINVPGEIYIGGAGVARGYLHDPKLTSERFIPDPFSGKPGARLYRTGDLALFRADGRIDFLGRVDRQVKIRGYRIELDEIEYQLKQNGGVRDAVVLVQQNNVGEKFLAAYLATDGAPAPDIADVRARLRAKLPEHMTPSAFVVMEKLPQTPNGKIDRKSLPKPDAPVKAAGFVAPRSKLEKQIATVWSDVLGVSKIGINDNFFDLGGHSLLAARAVSRMKSELNKPVALRDLFRSPTVAGLSVLLEQMNGAGSSAIPALVPLNRKRQLHQAQHG